MISHTQYLSIIPIVDCGFFVDHGMKPPKRKAVSPRKERERESEGERGYFDIFLTGGRAGGVCLGVCMFVCLCVCLNLIRKNKD